MHLGYNTNGFAHHRLGDAIDLLADLGYTAVALTLDVHHLDPFADDFADHLDAVRRQLARHRMNCVIETGARFLLDARRKHQPTLISPTAEDRQRRLAFLGRCVDVASELGADAVSFWSGTPVDEASDDELMMRLVDGCRWLCDRAAAKGVRLAFEPEPGMFIDTMPRFAELHGRVKRDEFGLTLDIGHLVCQGEVPIGEHVRAWGGWLWNLHVEDMRRGVHDHLMFGEGEVDFAEVFAALRDGGYDGGVYVELSRHSHDAVSTARRSIEFLRRFVGVGSTA